MSELPIASTQDPRHLFTIACTPSAVNEATDEDSETAEIRQQQTPPISGISFDLKLETCSHGKLRNGSDRFGSTLIFQLESTAPLITSIALDFKRRVAGENDDIDPLHIGSAAPLVTNPAQTKGSVAWSSKAPVRQLRFGVLVERNFNDVFMGTFNFTAVDTLRRPLQIQPYAELVVFDPSTAPFGTLVDPRNFEASSQRLLASLGLPLAAEIGQHNSTALSSTTEVDSLGREIGMTPDSASTMTGRSTKTKTSMVYHHKQRHIHKPHMKGVNARARIGTEHNDVEMQHLRSEDSVDDDWDDPIRYVTQHEMGLRLFGYHFTWTGVRCIRSVKMKLTQTNSEGQVEEYESSGHWSIFGMLIHKKQYHDEAKAERPDRYLVVGRMTTNGFVIREKIFRYRAHDEDHMLQTLHKGIRDVRGMRGFFSLKSVSGFGLYQCDPSAGHHTRLALSDTQRSCLRIFYNSYKLRSQGAPEFVWDDWIFKHLNNSSNNPMEGKYSLELLLSWSVLRLSIVTSIPVLLSLAVGFWYQTLPVTDGSDPTGTAWIIATYIITAGALIIAFLGVATGLEQS